MAKITRALQKIFGSSGATGQFGVIGSEAAGSPANSKDIEAIQALSQYLGGLYDITANGGEPPRIEDINSIYFMITTQLAYLFQAGVSEWDDDTDYYADISFVQRNGGIYQAVTGTDGTPNNGNDPATEIDAWREIIPPSAVSQWDNTTTYSTAGTIVQRGRRHYAASGKSGNTGKDPSLPENALFWLGSPGEDTLVEAALEGKVFFGGVHPATDYNDGDYQQNIKIDTRTIDGNNYDFYRVNLDGTVVTGDTTLEDTIFKIGESDEYPFSDYWCPDSLGTRTLIDMRGAVMAALDAIGGQRDTLAERLEDASQKITGTITGGRLSVVDGDLQGAFDGGATGIGTVTDVAGSASYQWINFDNSLSTSPNSAKTDDEFTRDKSVTVGVPYIIVMVAA